MKLKHPSTTIDFKLADVERDYIVAARSKSFSVNSTYIFLYLFLGLDYAHLVHPKEEKFYSDDDLNHAMDNMFAAHTHKKN
jgi:hypothetical protein